MGPILRKVLLFGSAGLLFVVLAISLTPITSPLPPYTGQFEVGILDLETEVEEAREVYGEGVVLKEGGEKAFEVCGFSSSTFVCIFVIWNMKELGEFLERVSILEGVGFMFSKNLLVCCISWCLCFVYVANGMPW